jgi:DMSO/TMAO reductase YedYZ molybdopterin-dependent catalytic subunit
MSKSKALAAGLLAGLIAGIAMTVVMLVLAMCGIATPLAIIGDRLSVFIKPGPFLALMGRVGGYNHLKQLGVGSTMAGQLVVSMLGGALFGVFVRKYPQRRVTPWTMSIFVALPIIAVAIFLWPVLGTSYLGFPISSAGAITLIGFALSVLVFERTLVSSFHFLTRTRSESAAGEFTPALGRRALILGGVGVLLAGGGVGLIRKLWRAATFSYDGTQYKGRGVQPITPNDLFYCVTKNVIDPRVNVDLWHLEVNGLVQNPRTYRFRDFKDFGFNVVEQETTLMCISNGLDAGLMSNAVWKGIALRDLIDPAGPLADVQRVKLYGVDNYTDTIPIEKALEETTLLAWGMNGKKLPDRHGYPLRAIVPGYFGEKHVKWLTRIELTGTKAKGFYETQGWGPDFITPTRSRIDVPDHDSRFTIHDSPIEIKGIAFGGDRGISRVEISDDDGETWTDAKIIYPGTKLTWALWSFDWQPDGPDDYTLVVRATDGEGEVQEWEEDRSPYSGVTGFHKIIVHITA